ncbi:Cys-tRNA(Pro) deacylase [Rothia sp. P7181]|uniref:Cys-tRNA(Pro) deacylase n=1 Tax=unclassified Rothia (in: high G+C Gram-positive bacteria) TaxID=2689056 RepID=UPI003ACC47B8
MAKKKKNVATATAALQALSQAGIIFEPREYEHREGETSFGLEAATALGRSEQQVFKTLMIAHDNNYAVCIVPVAGKLNLKAAAAALSWKNATMADPKIAERRSGYVVGGISPIGQKIAHPTLLDSSAEDFATVLVSGGKRGLDVELSPQDLLAITNGTYAKIALS